MAPRALLHISAPLQSTRINSHSSARGFNKECWEKERKARKLFSADALLARLEQFRCYGRLFRQSTDCSGLPQLTMWQSPDASEHIIKDMFRPPEPSRTINLTATDFASFLDMVPKIEALTVSISLLVITVQTAPLLLSFSIVTAEEINVLLSWSRNYIIGSRSVCHHTLRLFHVIRATCRCSLACFNVCMKEAGILPLLKMSTLNIDAVSYYRPISNLPFVFK
jgi:hypothetical protein